MGNVKHRIFVGHPVDGESPVETFYILAENGDRIITEDNNPIIQENG